MSGFRRNLMKQAGGGRLPAGYTEVDWIKPNNSAAYIRLSKNLSHLNVYDDTDIINLQVYGFEVVIEPTNDTPPAEFQIYVGGRSGPRNKFSSWVNLTDNYQSIGFGSGNALSDYLYRHLIFAGDEHTIRWNNGMVSVDGNDTQNFSPLESPSWNYVCLFCCWYRGQPYLEQRYVGKIKYARFWDENGDTLWEGIPCRKDLTGEYGFYDIFGDFFYGNAGVDGTSLIGGYD